MDDTRKSFYVCRTSLSIDDVLAELKSKNEDIKETVKNKISTLRPGMG